MVNHNPLSDSAPATWMALWKIPQIQRDIKHHLCSLEAYTIIMKTGTEDEKKIDSMLKDIVRSRRSSHVLKSNIVSNEDDF